MFDNYSVFMTEAIEEKLRDKQPPVTYMEVEEAFYNLDGTPLIDTREKNRTKPPTVWFISETSSGRILKISGIFKPEYEAFVIKSAYEPDDWEIDLYEINQK